MNDEEWEVVEEPITAIIPKSLIEEDKKNQEIFNLALDLAEEVNNRILEEEAFFQEDAIIPKDTFKDIQIPEKKKEFKISTRAVNKNCPFCGEVAKEIDRYEDGDAIFLNLECGHQMAEDKLSTGNLDNWQSHSGHKPYPFQKKGIKFLEESQGRALIADEMRLGKTIQALGFLKFHPDQWPFLIIAKASLKIQWYREIIDWIGEPAIQIIEGGSMPPLNLFKGFIVSVDTLSRAEWIDDPEAHNWIKTIIIDECQTIKNMDAKRTKAVRKLCKDKERVIALSGTPIKNNAYEYFPVLNILRPQQFWSPQGFASEWVETHNNGYSVKYGGIQPHMLEDWNEFTKDFIIRRTREEVMPDLPKIQRAFQYHDLGEKVRASYVREFENFADDYREKGFSASNTLAYMSRMRHLTGLAKVDPCIDYVEDFLLENPDKKLTIFIHHRDVAGLIAMHLGKLLMKNNMNPPLAISGEMNTITRQENVDAFKKDPKNRIMIASTLAAGEGLNLQFCSDLVMVERQWNPANEEQAEGRFSRIGSEASFINAQYLVAIDTIDEMFARLVEEKRSFMASTLDGKEYKWDETSLMRELADTLYSQGRKPWMKDKKKVH